MHTVYVKKKEIQWKPSEAAASAALCVCGWFCYCVEMLQLPRVAPTGSACDQTQVKSQLILNSVQLFSSHQS